MDHGSRWIFSAWHTQILYSAIQRVGIGLWSKSGQDAVERDRVFINEVTVIVTAHTHASCILLLACLYWSLYNRVYTLLSPAIVLLSSSKISVASSATSTRLASLRRYFNTAVFRTAMRCHAIRVPHFSSSLYDSVHIDTVLFSGCKNS